MSETNHQRVINLAGLAIADEGIGRRAARAVWEQAQRESRLAFQPGNSPIVETGGLELVPVAEFLATEEATLPPALLRLNDSNHLTIDPPEAVEYQPLSLKERLVGGLLGLAKVTITATWNHVEEEEGHPIAGRDLVAVAASSLFSGRQTETSAPQLPPVMSWEEAGKAAILNARKEMTDKFGNPVPAPRDKTPADEAREAAYNASLARYGSMFKHGFSD